MDGWPGCRSIPRSRALGDRLRTAVEPQWHKSLADGAIVCHNGTMNLEPYIENVQRQLVAAAASGGDEARALADRTGPVGGDGLLLLTAGDDAHAFGMRMFNSDGSEAETCLNGLRCVARAGFEALGIEDNLKFARDHRDVVMRFGRFPSRNAALGRESTPEEVDYLSQPGVGW